MFERFTAPARRSVVLAQEEARQLGHQGIGTEHLLLGLIAQGAGVAARVLRSLGLSYDEVAERVRELKSPIRGAELAEHLPFDEHVQAVMKSCVEEADRLERDSIGTEHLLLAIVNEFKGLGAQILREHKLDHSRLASAVEQVLAEAEAAPMEEIWAKATAVSQAAGGVAPTVSTPRCPVCATPIGTGGSLRTEIVTTSNPDGTNRSVVLAYCGRCGRVLDVAVEGRSG